MIDCQELCLHKGRCATGEQVHQLPENARLQASIKSVSLSLRNTANSICRHKFPRFPPCQVQNGALRQPCVNGPREQGRTAFGCMNSWAGPGHVAHCSTANGYERVVRNGDLLFLSASPVSKKSLSVSCTRPKYPQPIGNRIRCTENTRTPKFPKLKCTSASLS